MKRLFSLILLLILVNFNFINADIAKVILSNGTEITGNLLSIDPLDGIVIEIAGLKTNISMTNIERIETLTSTVKSQSSTVNDVVKVEFETDGLPSDTILNVNGVDVRFVLIKGGTISYGYDGRGSWRNESEPVHDITVTPFYISDNPVSRELVSTILEKDPWKGYKTKGAKDANYLNLPESVFNSAIEETALFSIHDQSDVFNITYSEKYGTINDFFPSPLVFLDSLNSIQKDINFKILSESQWALLYKNNFLNVNFPLQLEFVGQVNFEEDIDPTIEKLMTKGLPYRRIPIYDNRHTFGNVYITILFKKKEISIGNGQLLIAPMHIVFPVKDIKN